MKLASAAATLAAVVLLTSCSAVPEPSSEAQFTPIPSEGEESAAPAETATETVSEENDSGKKTEESGKQDKPRNRDKQDKQDNQDKQDKQDQRDTKAAPAPANPNSFSFERGSAQLGPVDPEKARKEPFDLCSVVTDKELGQIGFKRGDKAEYAGIPFCGLTPSKDEQGTAYAMTSVPQNFEQLVANAESVGAALADPPMKTRTPGVVGFTVRQPEGFGCVAAVETTTGTVMTGAANLGGNKDMAALCNAAAKMMDDLHGIGK